MLCFKQNLKKSWHPQTLRNVEKVWKAEQKAEAESKKIEQLRKELEEERAREDMQRHAVQQGIAKWVWRGRKNYECADNCSSNCVVYIKFITKCLPKFLIVMHLSSAIPWGGGPRAREGTLYRILSKFLISPSLKGTQSKQSWEIPPPRWGSYWTASN